MTLLAGESAFLAGQTMSAIVFSLSKCVQASKILSNLAAFFKNSLI